MFGHDDKPKDDEQHGDNGFGNEHTEKVVAPVPQDGNDNNSDWQHPGTPLSDDAGDDKTESFTAGQDVPASDDHVDTPDNGADPAPVDMPTPAHSNDLIDIKQDALGKLSPLIGHLDQAPDEKFRTLMMMIQASDDQSLIQQAYDTALEITDEKTRAQALLDIVNEINYFTQNPKSK
jgi:hypothetical protein